MSGYLDGMPSAARTSKSSTLPHRSEPASGRTRTRSARTAEVQVQSSSDALAALSGVEQEMRALEVRRIRLIGAAQQHGASWEEIGSALEVSRQAAWEKYRDRVRAVLEATASRAGDAELEMLDSAARVLKEVRARRRRG